MPSTREYARAHLTHFASTRAPLLQDPRAAVLRAVGLGVLESLLRHCPDEDIRIMAAGTLEAHLKFAPSKQPATRKDYAAASALFADLARAAAHARGEFAAFEAVLETLLREDERGDLFRWGRIVARARVLAAAMTSREDRLRLIAARMLLVWTKAAAKRIGYGKREENSSSAAEEVALRLRSRRERYPGGRRRFSPEGADSHDPLCPSDISPATGEEPLSHANAPP